MNKIHYKILFKYVNKYYIKYYEFIQFIKYLPLKSNNHEYYLDNLKRNAGITTMESFYFHINSIGKLKEVLIDSSPSFVDANAVWKAASVRYQ